MKRSLILIFCFLLFGSVSASGPDKVISAQFDNVPFTRFCETIYNESGVKVFYQTQWVEQIYVSIQNDSITVFEAVTEALKQTDLNISIWNNQIILTKDEALITELPLFEQQKKLNDSVEQTEKSLTLSEERYLTGRLADVIQTIRIGKSGTKLFQSKAKVLGRVLDQETGEPIFYATVYISETKGGAVTDVNGFFNLLLKPGKYNATFEYLGYQKKKYLLEVLSDGEFTIRLRSTVIQMNEFVVYGDKQMNIKSKDPGLEKITMKSIKELPMMMGERDILKVSEMLPGIISGGEGSAGLNVRGGGSDQNAFYINKIPIYNTSHMFGFFPAFNSDIIKDFSIYKGHIPAQYGGRLSSVFNIITRQGNRKNFTAHGGISPIAANVVVEGPLKKDTSSIIISARSSYSDWILKRLQNPELQASTAGFYDFSGGVNYDIQKTQMSVFFYHSKDRFTLSNVSDYDYSNTGAALGFSHTYSNTIRGEFSVVASQYDFSTTNTQELSSAYQHAYTMGHYEGKADFTQVLTDEHTLTYGASLILYQLNRGTVTPYGPSSLHSTVALGEEQGIESALYISDSYDPKPWLNFTIGLRYGMFTPIGPKTVYTYTDGLPMDPRYINDSISFAKNQPISWYSEPDLRAAVNFTTDVNGSVKLAFNQMHQNLFMLNNTITVAPNAQWKLADYHLEPSKSDQVSLGVFRTLGKSGFETSVEVYYKKTENYPEFKDGADFLESPLVETTVLQGTQNAYGMEFFLRRSNRQLEGWLSYTYSRSMVHIDGGEPWNQINNGASYPANFDVPHSVNLVFNYHLSRRITFSSIITYQTGKPITYPVSIYYIDGVPNLDFSARNDYRIPDYFRTDLSLTLEGNLKKHKLLHSSLVFSVYNLTGRDNPYSVYFKNENGKIKGYQYSVIGNPIFTATWIFKLGNYASE